MLTQVVSTSGGIGRVDKALACMLLAKIEVLGSLRRKHERAEAHAMQVQLLSIPKSKYLDRSADFSPNLLCVSQ